MLCARRFPHASLLCFEPQEGPRAILGRALTGHPRLRIVSAAAAASAGQSIFYVSGADDSSSLLPTTDLQVAIFPGTRVVDRLYVPTQRLDVLVDPADLVSPVLLKVDVQGSELDVLRGATGILDRVATILVECSFVELYAGQALAGEVISMLHEHGFRLTSEVACAPSGSRVRAGTSTASRQPAA